jgi:tetratricopeptide (TPR) repeat protein
LKSRHFQAIAGITLALGGTIVPSALTAQAYNRVPDPNATRVFVATFKATEKGLGVQAADGVRNRMNSDFPYKQVYVLPKQDITATLEASGFPTTEALEPHDQRALAVILRADEYVTGTIAKTPTGVKVEANLVLARDNTLVQPLGTFDVKSVGDASSAISKELKEARKQLDAEKKCLNSARAQKYDEAIAAAKEGVTAYPKATLARICWANVLVTKKAPAAEQLEVAKEIVAIDPKSRPGLAIKAQSFRDLKMGDSAVVTLTQLLATDPKNPRLQKDVVDALAVLASPKVARPVIDQAVQDNPGDPDLLKLRWLILLSTRELKEALAQGEELVKLDTSFADTTYFVRTSIALAADSQAQKSAEVAAKGLQKFPNHPALVYQQVYGLRAAGQLQPALDALDKALAAKVPVENSSTLRITLIKDLGKGDEVLPAIKAAIASGDTTSNLRLLALQSGNEAYRKAAASKDLNDFATAVDVLKYADSVAPNSLKAQAQFLLGATYVQFGQAKLSAADAAKSCPLVKEAKDLFVEAQIMLPKGGSFAPEQMRTLMGAVMQLDPLADARVKVYCK